MTDTATGTPAEPRLPTPAPLRNPETEHFWDATGRGELLLKHCDDCDSVIWYPRVICPFCGSLNTSWLPASGRGEIYSFAINRRGVRWYTESCPYVIAYVELEEGPRILTHVVDCDPGDVRIGQRVEVVFHPCDGEEGSALYRFRPVAG